VLPAQAGVILRDLEG